MPSGGARGMGIWFAESDGHVIAMPRNLQHSIPISRLSETFFLLAIQWTAAPSMTMEKQRRRRISCSIKLAEQIAGRPESGTAQSRYRGKYTMPATGATSYVTVKNWQSVPSLTASSY
jgi:hypothetical protein